MNRRTLFLYLSLTLTALSLILTMWLVFPGPAQASDHTVGGACGATIQACIDYASEGETVIVPLGTWNESLTLGQPISLTGVSSATAIIQALSGQRVLTVTGAAIDGGLNSTDALTVTSSYNLFFANGTDMVGTITDSNSLQGNPRFADAASNDFRLGAGSIAIDSGINAGITTDILGVSRPRDEGFDRGAYEGRKLIQVYLPIIRGD